MSLDKVQYQTEAILYLNKVVDGAITTPLLLIGPKGVGKHTSVKAVANAMFFDETQRYQLDRGIHPDFLTIAPEEEGKEIKVEAIREIVEEAQHRPSRGPLRFFVIDGADKLTVAASNALLKTLEEPLDTTRFFLLAETLQEVLPTIRSRSSVVYYQRLPTEFVIEKLVEVIGDPETASLYANLSQGSLGLALDLAGSGALSVRDTMLSAIKYSLENKLSDLFSLINSLESNLRTALHLLETILSDLVLVARQLPIMNTDIRQELEGLTKQCGTVALNKARTDIRLLQKHSPGTNTSYHLKTLLAIGLRDV